MCIRDRGTAFPVCQIEGKVHLDRKLVAFLNPVNEDFCCHLSHLFHGYVAVSYTHLDVYKRQADGTMLETAWESRWVPDFYGGVAQLGEHLPCKQGVKSSNLSISIC